MPATQTAKTYRAKSMAEALASVKHELGPDAVILSARKVRDGGLLGRSHLEVLASPPTRNPRPVGAIVNATSNGGLPGGTGAPPVEIKGLQDAILHMREEIRASRVASQQQREDADTLADRLREEMQGACSAVRSLLAEAQLARSIGLPDGQVNVIRQLVDNGIEAGNAEAIVRAAQQDSNDPTDVRRAVAAFLAQKIRTVLPLHVVTERRVAAFVGPTGVGKTTTIAKIAAACVVSGRRVGLITTDTFRIAAIDQLKCYADLMGIPLEVADSPEAVCRAIERLKACQIILIDSAGRSPRAKADLEKLGALLSRAWVSEIHLVLQAGTHGADVRRTLEGFRILGPTRLLWTKLDETSSYGSLFNGQLWAQLPLSYLSMGQRVPEDLEAANPERVTRLLLWNAGTAH